MSQMYILMVILLPLLSFVTILVLGNQLGHRGSSMLSIGNLIMAFFISVYYFYNVLGTKGNQILRLWPWLEVGDFKIYWDFYLDINAIIMFMVVTFVSSLVHIYSRSYMSEDPHQSTFMSYLSLFTFFMLILVSSGNFFQMFLGWEGVGLCSFLLISFWSDRVYAVGSAIKAIVLNRIGDMGLLLAMVYIYVEMGTLDFAVVLNLSVQQELTSQLLGYEINTYTIICLCLLLAAVGKSSQYLLHGWLPDAMEGPTPVSALIHAATMVTAGVFLLIRCSNIFLMSPRVLALVCIFGFLTALFGAFTGSRVYDLKKMIAYSTTSHLGYMFMACGLMAHSIALFHLVVHACFKALLFLSAGSVIHSFSNEQDVRKMSGLDIYIPITVISLVIGSATMNGLFGLSGALSKDNVLYMDFFGYNYFRFIGFGLLLISVFLGSLYTARIVSFFFENIYSEAKEKIKSIHESDFYILVPLLLLSFLSVYIGFFLENFFKDEFSSVWFGNRSAFHYNYSLSYGEYNSYSLFFKTYGGILSDEDLCLLIENVAAFGTFFAIYLYKMKQNFLLRENIMYKNDIFVYFYNYTEKRSMTDRIYNKFFSFMEFRNAKVYFFDYFERGVLEWFGPTGISNLVYKLSEFFSRWSTGLIHNYLFFMVSFMLLNLLWKGGLEISLVLILVFSFLILKEK